MDEPAVLALSLLLPFALGLGLRLKGAVLAAVGLAGWAMAMAWDEPFQFQGGPGDSIVGAAMLGAGGGFALGWAGSLTRRLARRR